MITTLYTCPLPHWRWLDFIGGISYEIYLLHSCLYFTLTWLGLDSNVAVIVMLSLLIPSAWVVHRVSCRIIRALD